MRSRIAALAFAVTTVAGGLAFAGPAQAAAPAKTYSCAHTARQIHCDAILVTGRSSKVGTVNAFAATPSGYFPVDIQSAYNLPSSTAGTGQTVAIVDAYDDPSAEADLGVYRAQFGLPACTTANGCFRKVDQNGGTSYPPRTAVGPRRSPSTSTWSRRSARSATSCWSRRRRRPPPTSARP